MVSGRAGWVRVGVLAAVVAAAGAGVAVALAVDDGASSTDTGVSSTMSPPAVAQPDPGASCPVRLPGRGLPADPVPDVRPAEPTRTLAPAGQVPTRVTLCRYVGRGMFDDGPFDLVAQRELPSSDGPAVVEDLRTVRRQAETITSCARRPEPTPFVLVLEHPDGPPQVIRADADATCAYVRLASTDGREDFAPIGNDLAAAWAARSWQGLSQ